MFDPDLLDPSAIPKDSLKYDVVTEDDIDVPEPPAEVEDDD